MQTEARVARRQRLLQAETANECQTWHTVGQRNGADAYKEFASISAFYGEISIVTCALYVVAVNDKKKLLQTKILLTTYIINTFLMHQPQIYAI